MYVKISLKFSFYLFLVVFVIKAFQILLLHDFYLKSVKKTHEKEYVYAVTGDTESYIQPFESLFVKGTYAVENSKGEKVYAGRMPFYGLLYYALRYCTNDIGLIFSIQVLVQLLLETLAIICLLQLMLQFSENKYVNYFGFLILLLSLFWTHYTMSISPESIGLSILVFIFYYHNVFLHTHKHGYLLLNSFLCLFLIGLKPYFAVLPFVLLVDIVTQQDFFDLKKVIRYCLSILLIPVIVLSLWAIRNNHKLGTHVFLTQKNSGYAILNQTYMNFRALISLWGQSTEEWEKSAMASYFFQYRISDIQLVDIPTNEYFNKDSVAALKQLMSSDFTHVSSQVDSLNAARINKIIVSFHKSNPEMKFISGFKLVPKFLIHSGSYYISSQGSFWMLMVKVLQSFLYYLWFIFGFAGLILFLFKKQLRNYAFVPLFIVVFFCFIFKLIELRYFLYAYPFLFLGMMYSFSLLRNYLSAYNNIIKSIF